MLRPDSGPAAKAHHEGPSGPRTIWARLRTVEPYEILIFFVLSVLLAITLLGFTAGIGPLLEPQANRPLGR